ELGVIGEGATLGGLVADPWIEDELVALVSRRNRLARSRSLGPEQLASQPCITREQGSSTRRVTERDFRQPGLSLQPTMELGSTEAIREAVAAGLGVAIVSKYAAGGRDQRVASVRLTGTDWRRQMMVVRRANAPLGPAATRFRQLLL